MRLRRTGLLLAVLVCAACGGGGGTVVTNPPPPGPDPFGLTQRTIVQGVNFPTGLPQPTNLSRVNAFTNLSFTRPVFLTYAPDNTNRIFVVEVDGRIQVFPNDPNVQRAAVTEFLDIDGRVNSGGEEGLLGLAFHPDYATNGFFYVYYSASSPRRSVISRFSVSAGDANRADPASEQILLEISQPASNHNGGCLQFGPDNKLYIAVGDGGNQRDPDERAQDLAFLLGKILRLNDDGSVPNDNPFVGQAGVRPEIWALGFRNPWRFSFDRNTGTLWCGDVGQGTIEEVDIVTRGGNYGWDFFEGTRVHEGNANPANFIMPVAEYTHALGNSVTGGYVYRGPNLPSYFGAYFYADFGSGRVWALVYDGNQVISNEEVANVSNPASFGEDQQGEMYVCSYGGTIYKFEETVPGPDPGLPEQLSDTGLFSNVANLTAAPGIIEYAVNSQFWSDGARKRRWIALPGTARITFSATGAWVFPVGTVLVKHFEIDTPTGVRRLETRVLVNTQADWQGYTYKWNPAGTDADLLPGAETETITVLDNGGQIDLDWYFPSRADCNLCHTSAAGRVLGVRTRQLNGDFPYPAATDNQLRSWNNIGLFTVNIGAHTAYDAMPDPLDGTAPVADRARAYLASNCANCHLPGGPTPHAMDMRYGIPTAQMNLVGVPADDEIDGFAGTQLVQPFSRNSSHIHERIGRLDEFRMPPLASDRVDTDGRAVVGAWIDAGAD